MVMIIVIGHGHSLKETVPWPRWFLTAHPATPAALRLVRLEDNAEDVEGANNSDVKKGWEL